MNIRLLLIYLKKSDAIVANTVFYNYIPAQTNDHK